MTRDSKSLGKLAKRGVAWSFLREGVTEIVLFPASMLVARLLTPTEFGIAAAAIFFTQLATRLSELGFNAAIVRSTVVERVHLSTVFTINLLLGIGTFAALTACAPLVGAFYNVPQTSTVLRVAALAFLIAPFGAVPAALLTRNMRFRQTALVDWCQGLTFAVVSVLLAWLGFSYMSPVYGKLAAVFVQTVSRVAFARWRPALGISMPALREIFPFGAGVHAKRLLDYVAQNVDNLIVGRLMGMEALGFYDKAFSTMNRFLVRFNTGGPTVTFRIFAIIHDQPERFARAYSKVVMAAMLMALPFFAVLIVVAPQLMVVLFGGRWLPAAVPFQILCLAGCLRVLNTYASAATQAAGWIWSEVARQLIYTVLIVVSLAALRDFGVVGAALGVLGSTAMMAVAMQLLLRRVTRLAWSQLLGPQIPGVVCALGVGATVLLMEYGVRSVVAVPSSWLLLMCQGIVAASFYLGFVLFLPHRELRTLVHEMTNDMVPPVIRRQRWVQLYLASHIGRPTSAT